MPVETGVSETAQLRPFHLAWKRARVNDGGDYVARAAAPASILPRCHVTDEEFDLGLLFSARGEGARAPRPQPPKYELPRQEKAQGRVYQKWRPPLQTKYRVDMEVVGKVSRGERIGKTRQTALVEEIKAEWLPQVVLNDCPPPNRGGRGGQNTPLSGAGGAFVDVQLQNRTWTVDMG